MLQQTALHILFNNSFIISLKVTLINKKDNCYWGILTIGSKVQGIYRQTSKRIEGKWINILEPVQGFGSNVKDSSKYSYKYDRSNKLSLL